MAFLLTFSGGASATYKDAVRVARDSQLALSGATPLAIDGITLVDKDRVLLRGQTASEENGIYVCAISGGAYTLTRALDANNDQDVLPNMLVPVSEGTANADKIFQLVSPNVGPIDLDVDALVFTDVLIGLANKADRDLANLTPTAINQLLKGLDGSAAAPSYSFITSPATGIFSSGVNELNVSTSGVEHLRITSTGNVGIGSQSPNAKLQVNNSGTQLGLSVYSTSSNNTAELFNQGTTNYTLALNSAANSATTGASIGGYFARGTLSTRLQTLSQDSLLSISASGYTGSAIAGISGAIIIGADENTSANAYGGQIVFATTPNSTLGGFPIPRVYIKNDGKVNVAGLTASELIATDTSKNLQSLTTATYPSLTEISYVKGVTSSIQTQLNSKVSSVAGSAPISSSGGTTPTLSISQASAISDGYLSSTDWSTFNAKQNALTFGNLTETTSSVLTISGGTGSVIGSGTTIQVAQSGAITSGYLSSGDWNTFNNAATEVSNATALSTASTLMERDGSGETALDGLSLDGSTSGAIKLQAAATTTNYTVKMPSAQGAASTFLQNDGSGNLSWTAPSSLPSQTGNQYKVLATDGSSASWQFAGLGDGTLPSNTLILGRNLPSGMTATSGILIGTGSNLGTGASQVIIGASSGRSTTGATGANNTVVGSGSFNNASLTSAANNVVIGQGSGTAITTGPSNVIIGQATGNTLAIGGSNILIGGANVSSPSIGSSIGLSTATIGGDSSVCIGNVTQTSTFSVAVGFSAIAAGTNAVSIGRNAVSYVNDSTIVGAQCYAGSYGVAVGRECGSNGAITPNYTVCIGGFAGRSVNNASAVNNIFLGYSAGRYNTNQANELFIDSLDRTNYANQQTNSLIYGTFNATPSSQTITFNVGTMKVPNYILSPQLYDAGTKTANFTLDLGANGPCQQATINAAGPLVITLSNPVTGGAYLIKLVQGATPGTVTWPATVKWGTAGAPTLSSTTGLIDIVNLYWDGTNYFGTYALGY